MRLKKKFRYRRRILLINISDKAYLPGAAKGEKNSVKIKITGNIAIILSLIITLCIACLFLIAPKFLASFYLDVHTKSNQDIVHFAILLFAVCAFQQIFDAIRNVLTGSLRGLFDTRFPMFVGLTVIWLIGIPLGYLLAFPLHLGVVGISIGVTAGMMIGMIILLYRWKIKTA